MADNSKAALGLGGSRNSSLISDIKSGLSGIRQEMNLLKQETGSWTNTLTAGLNKLRGQGKNGASSNQVAPYPVFSNTSIEPYKPLPTPYYGGPGGNAPSGPNTVFDQPRNISSTRVDPTAPGNGGGGNAFTNFISANKAPLGYMAFAGAMQATPTTEEAFRMQLMTARSGFYGQAGGRSGTAGNAGYMPQMFRDGYGQYDGSYSGKSGNIYDNMRVFQQKLQNMGTVKDKFDVARALNSAQQYGITGGSIGNFQSIAQGAAQMSNLTPGIGVEGSMQAYGAMQQGRNVNMLRAVGIRIRDEQGNMKPMPQIIDELWTKLEREKRKTGGSGSSLRDVQISLQPGNALATMLDNMFGNDPYLRKQVEDGLLLKAQSNGMTFAGKDMKKIAEKYGATTAASSSISERTAESAKTLQQMAPAMNAAMTQSNRVEAKISGVMNLIDRWTGIMQIFGANKSFMETMGSGGNGVMGTVSTILASSLLKGFFKAEGGPVDNQKPYIVGERGPELFVPKEDGVIVPNHMLANPHRADGGPVKGSNPTKDLYNYLTKQGFSKGGAEGVIGNLIWESGLNPTIKGDKGTSYGIAQWHASRWDNLNKFAEKNNLQPGTIEAQQQFLMHELTTGYPALLKKLKDPNITKLEAAGLFMTKFERPKDQSSEAALKRANAYGKPVTGTYGAGGSADAQSPGTVKGVTSSYKDLFKPDTSYASLFGANGYTGAVAKGPNQSTTNNYTFGGVTIKIQDSANPQATLDALRNALQGESLMNAAGKM